VVDLAVVRGHDHPVTGCQDRAPEGEEPLGRLGGEDRPPVADRRRAVRVVHPDEVDGVAEPEEVGSVARDAARRAVLRDPPPRERQPQHDGGNGHAAGYVPRRPEERAVNTDLEARYRAYLAVLNERRLDDLVDYVHDELTYNGEPMTRAQYQDLIAADIAAIPDLTYDARLVVACGDQVACRIVFDCTPQREFLGFTPNGERLAFAEHVFYRFADGRIAAVSSLIDGAAIAAQLQA
jgi:predicted ester cyclase